MLRAQVYLDRINLFWTINETLPSGDVEQIVEAFLKFEQPELHQHPSFTYGFGPWVCNLPFTIGALFYAECR